MNLEACENRCTEFSEARGNQGDLESTQRRPLAKQAYLHTPLERPHTPSASTPAQGVSRTHKHGICPECGYGLEGHLWQPTGKQWCFACDQLQHPVQRTPCTLTFS